MSSANFRNSVREAGEAIDEALKELASADKELVESLSILMPMSEAFTQKGRKAIEERKLLAEFGMRDTSPAEQTLETLERLALLMLGFVRLGVVIANVDKKVSRLEGSIAELRSDQTNQD